MFCQSCPRYLQMTPAITLLQRAFVKNNWCEEYLLIRRHFFSFTIPSTLLVRLLRHCHFCFQSRPQLLKAMWQIWKGGFETLPPLPILPPLSTTLMTNPDIDLGLNVRSTRCSTSAFFPIKLRESPLSCEKCRNGQQSVGRLGQITFNQKRRRSE